MASHPVPCVVPGPTEEAKRDVEVPLSLERSEQGRVRVGSCLTSGITGRPAACRRALSAACAAGLAEIDLLHPLVRAHLVGRAAWR
jgi:hypothetical protein